jgi:hypothetical protein
MYYRTLPLATAEDEIQTVTVSSGTGNFKLIFDGGTTDNIAHDAAAATVESALEALDSIGSGNVAVTGSGGGPWACTFEVDLAGRDCPIMTFSSGDEVVLSIVETNAGVSDSIPAIDQDDTIAELEWTQYGWTQAPDCHDSVKVKFAEESEDNHPVHMLWRTSDTIIKKGVEEVAFVWKERDVGAFDIVLPTSVDSTTAASGDQTGYDKLVDGGETGTPIYYQLVLLMRAPYGKTRWFIVHFKKVRPVGEFEVDLGHGVTTLGTRFKCYASAGETDGEEIFAIYEMTSVKS